MLHKRTALVNHIHVTSLATASTFEIGDSSQIQALSRAIALQREQQLFYSNEMDFSQYDIFQEPIHFEPVTEPFTFEVESMQPMIKVNEIKVIGVSTSSILHIGNTKNVYLESRVKHIRQLMKRNGTDFFE